MVGTNILGGKYTKSKVSRTGMHGCTWGSQMCDGEEAGKGVRPHFQEAGLYSGIMGKGFLTLGFETGNDMVRVKFNSIQHLG